MIPQVTIELPEYNELLAKSRELSGLRNDHLVEVRRYLEETLEALASKFDSDPMMMMVDGRKVADILRGVAKERVLKELPK